MFGVRAGGASARRPRDPLRARRRRRNRRSPAPDLGGAGRGPRGRGRGNPVQERGDRHPGRHRAVVNMTLPTIA